MSLDLKETKQRLEARFYPYKFTVESSINWQFPLLIKFYLGKKCLWRYECFETRNIEAIIWSVSIYVDCVEDIQT